MLDDRFAFNHGAVRPLECLREGWRLIAENYWLFLGIAFVGMLIGEMVPLGIMWGPMICGIHICLLRQREGRRVSFENLFDGFQFFGQSLIATMIWVLPAIAIVLVLYVLLIVGVGVTLAALRAQGGQPNDGVVLSMLGLTLLFYGLIFALFTVINFLTLFVYPLIVDRELSGTEAIVVSMKAAFANFGGVLGVVILYLLLTLLGLLFCFVGLIFLLPICIAMESIAYRQVFPASDQLRDELRPEEWDDDDPDGADETGIQTEPGRRRSDAHVREG